jgi:ATP-dependent protease ClpP protease subunit
MDPLKKEKNPIAFKAQVSDDKTLSIDMFDVIGQTMFGDGITAESVKNAMDEAGEYSSVVLNVSSPGGDMFQGVSIRNLLSQCGKPVSINVVGMCASAASLVATAGKVTMAPGTCYMLHEAQGMSMGDADTMRKMADTLDTVTSSASALYTEKTGKSKKDILALMKAETWMTPEQAVKDGFADCIGGKKMQVTNSFDLSLFRNIPEEFKNQEKTKEVDGEHLTAGDFCYVGNPDDTSTWSLPWKFSTAEKTKSHLRDALARFDQDEVIPPAHRDEVYAKLLRLCKEHGIEVSRRGNAKNESSLDIYAHQLEINKRK